MALRLILGPAASGKGDRIYETLADAACREQPSLVLPTAIDARASLLELARRGIRGVAVNTFDEAVARMWMLHGDGRRLVTAASRATLVQSVIERSASNQMGESGRTRGFALLVADVARRVSVPAPAPADTAARQMAEIIREYHRALELAGFIEPVSATELLARRKPDPGGPWCAMRFTDFDPAQEALLLTLAQSRDVVVALTWSDGAATEGITPLVDRLRTRAETVELAAEQGRTDPHLRAFTSALFEASESLVMGDAVSFHEASGGDAECVLVANAVREALNSGADAGSIAVTFRDPGRRLDSIGAALSARGVPTHVDVRVPFSRTAFGAASLALLDACAGRGEPRERLLAFLMSPCSGLDKDVVARLDRTWRSKGLDPRSGVEEAIRAAGGGASSAARLLQLGKQVVRSRVDVRSSADWQKMAGLLLAHASASEDAFCGASPGPDSAAHRALLAAVSDTAAIGEGVGEEQFSQALRSVEVSTAPGKRADEILVTEAHRLKGQRFDVVVVGGLNADEFSPEPRESLAAAMLMRLGRPVGHDERLVERALFHSVATRARQKLVLVRQAFDERGEALRPSAFWEEALDVYRGIEAAVDGSTPASIPIGRLSLASAVEAAPAYLPGRVQARAAARSLAPRVPDRGILADQTVRSALADRRTFSVSEVERYLQCPYKWFMETALRPREIDRAFDVREKGSLAHEILAEFYRAWRALGHARVTPGHLTEALEELETAGRACAQARTRSGGQRLSEELDIADAHAWARAVVIDDAEFLPGFRPAQHEVAFGSDDEQPMVLAGLELKGFVDRIDEGPEGLVVIDYKAAAQLKGWSSFATAGLIQVPIYAAVVSKLLGRPVVGAVYRSLSTLSARGVWIDGAIDLGGRGCGRDGVDREELDSVVADAVDRLEGAVRRIRSGDIALDPATGACRRCGFAGHCEGARR
ncbi:MAG: PD-(D/E)XK nuclease family protein [Coriobacteriia bacterium]|nr:PD-(D/E)XK nuclease family protein [Coriobacteriia bacterium]